VLSPIMLSQIFEDGVNDCSGRKKDLTYVLSECITELEHTFLRADESTRSREGCRRHCSPMLVLFPELLLRPVYTCKHKAVTVKCRGACHEITCIVTKLCGCFGMSFAALRW